MSQIEKNDHLNIETISKIHRWRMAFFGTIILLAGIVIGGALMMIFMSRKMMAPSPGPEFDSLRMITSLRRNLGLSTEQSRRISPILDKYMKELGDIRMEARTEIAQTLKEMNEDICEVLTDRQERLWKRSLEQLQQGLRPGPGGLGRRGEGPGGMRQRRGQQDRRVSGPFGPRRRPGGPSIQRDDTKPDANQTVGIPIEDVNQ